MKPTALQTSITSAHLFSYGDFIKLVTALQEEGKVTGNEQSTALSEATSMNLHRMKRLDKTTVLNKEMHRALEGVEGNWTWYLLTEGWCGDGSQNLPIIAKMADYSPAIVLKLLLRDENPEIMEQYLTNAGRAIPKLVCIENETGRELGTWGPRPRKIQEMASSYKVKNPEADKYEFAKNLHLWYARDKGNALQKEFIKLINEWKNK